MFTIHACWCTELLTELPSFFFNIKNAFFALKKKAYAHNHYLRQPGYRGSSMNFRPVALRPPLSEAFALFPILFLNTPM